MVNQFALTESRSVQDFLKQIYLFCEHDKRVSTNDMAEMLSIAPASVTDMAKRLLIAGLVEYEKYHGIELTETGKQLALRIIRRHRLLELYLVKALGYGWDEVHEEAEQLEHVISDRFVEALAQALGNPEVDPHGDPIPTPDGAIVSIQTQPLPALSVGQQGVIRHITDQAPELLRHLAQLGLTPNTTIELIACTPLGDTVTIASTTGTHTLSTHVASKIMLTPL